MDEPKLIYTTTGIRFGMKYINKNKSGDGLYHSYRKRLSKSQKEYFTIISSRTWGWFPNLKEAQQAVDGNYGDMYEGEFSTLVIEEVPDGVMGIPKNEWWYEWEGTWEEGKYILSKKPEDYENVVSFWEIKREINRPPGYVVEKKE